MSENTALRAGKIPPVHLGEALLEEFLKPWGKFIISSLDRFLLQFKPPLNKVFKYRPHIS